MKTLARIAAFAALIGSISLANARADGTSVYAATTEVLVVLIEPLPPRTHPKVTVSAGATTTEFTGSVVTPGALVLLPEKASALVEHAWQSIPELAVAITEDKRSLRGVIPVADIGSAMRTLQLNCLK